MSQSHRSQCGNDADGKLHNKLPVQPGIPDSEGGNSDGGRVWNCSGQRILEALSRCCLVESMPVYSDDGAAAPACDRSPSKKPLILVSVVRRFMRPGRLRRNIKSIAKSPRNVVASVRLSRLPREYLAKRRPIPKALWKFRSISGSRACNVA